MIKLRLITEPGFFSWAIRYWTDSGYSHVDLALPDGTFLGARLNGGVRIRPANYVIPSKQLYLGKEFSPEVEQKMLDYAKSKIGIPYDWRNIMAFGFDQDYHSSKHGYICSVFVFDVLNTFGYPPIRVDYSNQCTPADLTFSLDWKAL